MKINYNLLICLFSFITLVSISSCKPPDDTPPTNQAPQQTFCDTCLPPITTTGPTSFGCRVNGKVWLARDVWWYIPRIKADYYDNNLTIGAVNSEAEDIGFNIEVASEGLSVIFPNSDYKTSAGFAKFENGTLQFKYHSEPIASGNINLLRCDTDSGKFAGTFEFDVYSNDFKDTIHITDGRFMIHK